MEDLTYWLGTYFHGKGYMTEAVRHAMAAGFQYLDVASTPPVRTKNKPLQRQHYDPKNFDLE